MLEMKKRENFNKRGLSTIFITVIIILLVLVAIGIVWGVTRNISFGNGKEVSQEHKDFEDISLGEFNESVIIRKFSSTTINTGEIVTVTLYTYSTSSDQVMILEEYIPSEWTVIGDGGGDSSDPSNLRFLATSSFNYLNQHYSLIYTVRAPFQTGSYNFDGGYYFNSSTGEDLITTKGQTTVTVI